MNRATAPGAAAALLLLSFGCAGGERLTARAPDGSVAEARWEYAPTQPNVARSEFRVDGPGRRAWSARLPGSPAFLCVADGGDALLVHQRGGPALLPEDLHLLTPDGGHRVVARDAFTPAESAPSYRGRFFLRDCWWSPGDAAWALLTADDRLLLLPPAGAPRPAGADEAARALADPERLPALVRARLAQGRLRAAIAKSSP